MTTLQQALVAAAGFVLAIGVAMENGMPAADVVTLLALSFGVALAVGAVGGAVLRGRRRASVRQQAVLVALASVLATGFGAFAASRAMFVSAHDLAVLLVVLIASGTIGVLAAARLGTTVGAASERIGDAARRIGTGSSVTVAYPDAPAELARLADELDLMQDRLDEARSRERALDQSRRELVAWVSHDLRTPIAAIRAMVEALNDRVVDDQATIDRYHLTIQAEADRLARLVDDLFELSRIEAGAIELQLEEASVGDIVSDAVASVAAVAGRKGVRVVGTPARSPVADLATPEMSRVVRNLLDNAIRHTPAGGQVVVEVGEDGDDVVVAVSDECGGIAEDDLDRVFDLAFRGDPARTPGSQGGGLGLAIARGLVNAHDGAIAVQNADHGCRFTVRLPRRGGQRSTVLMSRTARSVPRTVPVTFDVPARAE